MEDDGIARLSVGDKVAENAPHFPTSVEILFLGDVDYPKHHQQFLQMAKENNTLPPRPIVLAQQDRPPQSMEERFAALEAQVTEIHSTLQTIMKLLQH